jgi:hypothetical protein
MPFAAALHVYSQREAATAATAPAPPRQQRAAGQQQQEQHQQDSGLVELSYVISGARDEHLLLCVPLPGQARPGK